MSLALISPNKRLTRVEGRGVQFLPGYPEPFNVTLRRHLRDLARPLSVIEVGAGGLSFVFRVVDLPNVRRMICCDPDVSALDFYEVAGHYRLPSRLLRAVQRKCTFVACGAADLFGLLRPELRVDVIVALRVCHFFSPPEFETFLETARRHLRRNGRLVLSGLGRTDHDHPGQDSEFYAHSRPIGRHAHYRRLDPSSATARRLLREQNLQREILFFDEGYVRAILARHGFRVVLGPARATRVVDGYVGEPTTSRA